MTQSEDQVGLDILEENDQNSGGETLEEECEVEWKQDSSVPPGWSYKYNTANRKTTLQDQAGKKHDGRRNALLHLMRTEQSLDQVAVLDQGLSMEGWNTSQHLPHGWKCRVSGQKRRKMFYMTDTYDLIESDAQAASYIQQKYDEDSEKSFEIFLGKKISMIKKPLTSKIKKPSGNINESSNKTLPRNWKQTKDGRIQAPNGKIYKNRRAALKEMIPSGLYTRAEADLMRSCLKFEGWKESSDIPSGWMTKKKNKKVLFATNDGDLFDSIVSAARFVHKYEKYFSKEDIAKIEGLRIRDNSKIALNQTEEVNLKTEMPESDEEFHIREDITKSPANLPSGWKVENCKSIGNKIYISPDGRRFNGPAAALRFMVKQKFVEEEISQMRDYCLTVGWKADQSLPSGWLMKKGKTSSFIGPFGEYLRGREKLMQFLESQGSIVENKNEKTVKVETRSKKSSKPKRSDSWTPSDGTIPEGWKFKPKVGIAKIKILLAPEGKVLIGRRSALKYMHENNYDLESILEMRNLLIDYDDWNSHDELPKNWLFKEIGKETNFCSPKGDRIRTKEKALKFLANCSSSDKDLEKMRAFNLQQNLDSSWCAGDDSVPAGWRMKEASVGTGKYTNFLLPCGTKLKGRRAALNFMVENNYSETSITSIRKSLIQYENWKEHQHLPANWLVKVQGHINIFCSENGKLFESRGKALKYLMKVSESEVDIEKIRNFKMIDTNDSAIEENSDAEITIDNEDSFESIEDDISFTSDISTTTEDNDDSDREMDTTKDELDFGSDISINTSDVPDIEPSNTEDIPKKSPSFKYRCRLLYRKYSKCLIGENFSTLDSLKEELSQLGWMEATDLLPEYWMMRVKPGFTNINFLTPSGKNLQSIADARKYLAKSGQEFSLDSNKLKERLKSF